MASALLSYFTLPSVFSKNFFFSNVFPFPGLPFGDPLFHSPSLCLYEGAPPPTHPLSSSHPGIPLHQGVEHPQAQGPLLPLMSNKDILCHIHMWPAPWVPPCVFFGWWSSPRELRGVCPVDTVAPSMGLQTPLAPSVPSPSPPSGTPTTVQWLAESFCLCICQALAEPLRRQPYCLPSASTSRHPQ